MKEKWEEWKQRYWPPKKDQLLILVLIGLLLAVIVFPVEQGERKEQEAEEVAVSTEVQEGAKETYEERMERKLERLLGSVEGVGEVRVMLTFVGSGEKQVEKDRNTADEGQSEETIYEEHEGNERMPYVTSETNPRVEGILVIAQGGGDSQVRKEILEAAQALFGIEAHKIKIMKMEETK